MAKVDERRKESRPDSIPDDSAAEILRGLEEERGKMFTEKEYHEMRRVVLDELAHGARCRPFTLVTFAVIKLGLLGLIIIGLMTARSNSFSELALPIVGAAALLVSTYFVWSYLRGLRQDALRSLDERLAELEELRQLRLVSAEEFNSIHAHILMSRQQPAEVRK